MTNASPILNENVNLESLGHSTLTALAGFYSLSTPEKKPDDFTQEFLIPMASASDTTGAAYLAKFREVQQADETANLQYGPMLISCAYCIEALHYSNLDQRELAWSRMAESRYWCGVTLASQGLETARDKTVIATRKATGKKAAAARSEINYKQTKDEAFRLVRERKPALKGWQSRRQAMLLIKDDVIEFAERYGKALSASQAEKTIYEWLAQMPDATTIFPQTKTNK